jgi:acyl-CoA thioester hydrolase
MQSLIFETARVFQRMGITPSVLRGDSPRMAGVQQNISYLKELLPGDLVLVKSKLVEMRERSLKMRHEMQHVESGELCATCELTAVCIDPQTRKPKSFPPEIAAKAKEIL